MQTLFKFDNVNISIGSSKVFSRFNWTIRKGEHTWLSGANATGKTILCKAMVGRCRITGGSARPIGIQYSDIKMVSFTDDGKLFHSVNNVHYYQQRFNSWDADGHMTARDYLIAKGIKLETREHQDFLEKIDFISLLDTERIKLSSGQTRKLLLASALLSRPKLLILDNPYIGLDLQSRSFLNAFLDDLALQDDLTLILSGQATILPKCIGHYISTEKRSNTDTSPTYEISNAKISEQSLRKIKNFYKTSSQQFSNYEILKLSDISISYGQSSIIDDLSWQVYSGDRWSLLGANGSGKSTIVSMIYADHPQAYSQDISIFGKRLGAGRSIWDIKKMIGFTSPELHAYFRTDLTAEEVVLTGLFDKFEIMSTVQEHYKVLCQSLFEHYNLSHICHQPYSTLSTGHQRLCLLIRALIKCPPLLLLDEPFQGLDTHHIEQSKKLIDEIIQPKQALIFISHFDTEIPNCVTRSFNLSP